MEDKRNIAFLFLFSSSIVYYNAFCFLDLDPILSPFGSSFSLGFSWWMAGYYMSKRAHFVPPNQKYIALHTKQEIEAILVETRAWLSAFWCSENAECYVEQNRFLFFILYQNKHIQIIR